MRLRNKKLYGSSDSLRTIFISQIVPSNTLLLVSQAVNVVNRLFYDFIRKLGVRSLSLGGNPKI